MYIVTHNSLHIWCDKHFVSNLPHLHSPNILHTHWTFILLHTPNTHCIHSSYTLNHSSYTLNHSSYTLIHSPYTLIHSSYTLIHSSYTPIHLQILFSPYISTTYILHIYIHFTHKYNRIVLHKYIYHINTLQYKHANYYIYRHTPLYNVRVYIN